MVTLTVITPYEAHDRCSKTVVTTPPLETFIEALRVYKDAPSIVTIIVADNNVIRHAAILVNGVVNQMTYGGE